MLLSGLAHVTLPEGEGELWIMEGVNGLMIAADVYGDGHFTRYPSDKPSVALQIPLEGGKMPKHHVVGRGVCDRTESLREGKRFVEGAVEDEQVTLE